MSEIQEILGSAVAQLDITRDYSIEQECAIEYIVVHIPGARVWVIPLTVPYSLDTLIAAFEQLIGSLKKVRDDELVRIDMSISGAGSGSVSLSQ